jgi:hypothetical protein
MKISILLAIILLCGLALIGLNWMQGAITANEFSHDLELLNYDGWQYTLKQPANYRSHNKLEWRFWLEEYDRSYPPKRLRSNRPEKARYTPTDSMSRKLPIDIILNRITEDNNYYWDYRTLLAFSGGGNRIKGPSTVDGTGYSVGFSLPKQVEYAEKTPMLLGEVTMNMGPQEKSRVFRWYLEIEYTDQE